MKSEHYNTIRKQECTLKINRIKQNTVYLLEMKPFWNYQHRKIDTTIVNIAHKGKK